MGEKEKSVFETLNENMATMVEQLKLLNDSVVVAAIEIYETRRDLINALNKINATLGTMAGTEFKPETKEVSTIENTERFEKAVFPKSTTSEQTEEQIE